MARVGLVALVAVSLAGTTMACSEADDCNTTHTCVATAGASGNGTSGKSGGSGAEGGSDTAGSNSGGSQGNSGTSGSGGEAGGPGSGCEGDVADDAACWTTNELGVFVSSDSGDDAAGNGSKELPYASLGKAIQNAVGKNVYVCVGVAEAYVEKLTVTDESGDGVKIYGGFECAGWTHDVARYVTVESPENIALRVQDLQVGLHIENVRFVAADGAGSNPSSYGAFVTNSKGVVLRRVELTAGDGMAGADGDEGGEPVNGTPAGDDQDGDGVLCGEGTLEDGVPGKWAAAACGTKGGNGGAGVKDSPGGSGLSGTPLTNTTPLNKMNFGAASSTVAPGEDGTFGGDGNAGPVGLAAASLGALSISGYAPANGHDGEIGFPGQGGGGGGSSVGKDACRGASGGAGGMGGCGGKAGGGGKGGGASIGLFVWQSDIALEASKVSSGSGGKGGDGGVGGGGGAGASGGSGGGANVGKGIARAGNGGPGGNGGNGGSGSGGTGGPSYAIAYSGAKPIYTAPDTILTPGDGGAEGVGGELLTAKAPNGSPGDSAAELGIP